MNGDQSARSYAVMDICPSLIKARPTFRWIVGFIRPLNALWPWVPSTAPLPHSVHGRGLSVHGFSAGRVTEWVVGTVVQTRIYTTCCIGNLETNSKRTVAVFGHGWSPSTRA